MRLVRILVAAMLVGVMLLGGAIAIAWRNQDRLIQVVLTRIHAETGYDVVPTGSRLAIRSHLVVLLENPRVYLNGVEVAQVDDLRAVISFHSIFNSNGLPLHAIVLDHPRVRMPAALAGVTPHGFPKPDIEVVNRVKWALDAISDVAQRIEHNGQSIGTIYLHANINELRDQFLRYIAIVAAMIFISLGCSILLSARFQRLISLPILQLAEAAKAKAAATRRG